MSNQQIPIACDMNALLDRDAHLLIGQQLMPQAEAIIELDIGYQIKFPIAALQIVAEFVDGERRCCPFIHFELSIPPATQKVELSITGDEGVKAFLKQEFLPHLPVMP